MHDSGSFHKMSDLIGGDGGLLQFAADKSSLSVCFAFLRFLDQYANRAAGLHPRTYVVGCNLPSSWAASRRRYILCMVHSLSRMPRTLLQG